MAAQGNGSKAAPSRDQIIMSSVYYAAVEGHYDTSEAAQKRNLLTISVVDVANMLGGGDPLPPGATHKFYVMVDASAFMVTRYSDESYKVEPHDQTESQRQERELREAVLDAALWHCTGEGAGGYHAGAGAEVRAAVIKQLLEEGPLDQEPEAREESDPIPHPVIREGEPDLSISLAPGEDEDEGPQPLRQWSVEIGPYNRCSVLFFGYRQEDGQPELITQDWEDDDEDEPAGYYDDDDE